MPSDRPATSDSAPLDVGERVGSYVIGRALGRGGMGVVYRAAHAETGQTVALKTTLAQSRSQIVLLRREIEALARLSHPGIVGIVEHGTDEGHGGKPWYAMELVDGLPLRSLFKGVRPDPDAETAVASGVTTRPAGEVTGRWWTETLAHLEHNETIEPTAPAGGASLRPEDERRELLTILARLCEPLAYLHGEGAVHRDLKPENILVQGDGQPVIVDFGLASRFGGEGHREVLDAHSLTAGTVAYMAPEQLTGQFVDARADLYALGVMLYEAVTGRRPFDGGISSIRAAKLRIDTELFGGALVGCEPKLVALIERLMATSPRDRPGYASFVRHTLGEIGFEGATDVRSAHNHLYRPGFVGRVEELGELATRLMELTEGHGAFVVIEGSSGSGKTRLATELLRRSDRVGVRQLTGECPPLAGASADAVARPLVGFQEPLRRLAEDPLRHPRGVEWLQERARLIALADPTLAASFEVRATELPVVADTADLARRIAVAVTELLVEAARSTPLVLAIDDVQWADDLSLACLERLAARAHDARLLLIVTARTEEMPSELAELLRDSELTRPVLHLRLAPISTGSVGRMVGDMLAVREPPARLTAFLRRHTDGNPFFVAEYVRTAVNEGVLERDWRGEWKLTTADEVRDDFDDLPLPRTLDSLLGLRLARLSDDERVVLSVASVLGRGFGQTRLEEALRCGGWDSGEPLERVLAQLERQQILWWVDAEHLRFRHDRLLEATYAGLSESERVLWHRVAAKVLERDVRDRGAATTVASSATSSDQSDDHALLVRHWAACGESARAAESARKAAHQANQRGARSEARRLFARYLDWTADAPVSLERYEDRLLYFRACIDTGRSAEELTAAIVELESEAKRLGTDNALGRFAHAETIRLHRQSRYDEALRASVRAVRYFEVLGAADHLLNSTHMQAVVLFRLGRLAEAAEVLGPALAAAAVQPKPVGERRAQLAWVYSTYGLLLRELGRLEAARTALEQSLDLHGEDVSVKRATALNTLGGVLLYTGHAHQALTTYKRALAIHRELGSRLHQGFSLHDLGEVYLVVGDPVRAADCYEAAERIFATTGDTSFAATCRARRGLSLVELGRLAEATEAAEASLEGIAPTHHDRGTAELLLARIAIVRGEPEAAREHLGRVSSDSQMADEAQIELAEVDAAQGGDRGLAAARRRLEALLEGGGVFRAWEQAHAELALASVLRRQEEDLQRATALLASARRHFEAATNQIGLAHVDCEGALIDMAWGIEPRSLETVGRVIASLGIETTSPLGTAFARASAVGDQC